MLELMKKPHTEYLHVLCPVDSLQYIINLLKENGCTVENDLIPAEEVFELKPSTALRGARYKEDLTQKKLSSLTGISVRRIRDMENDRIPIDEATAKVLGEALNIGYNVFL